MKYQEIRHEGITYEKCAAAKKAFMRAVNGILLDRSLVEWECEL